MFFLASWHAMSCLCLHVSSSLCLYHVSLSHRCMFVSTCNAHVCLQENKLIVDDKEQSENVARRQLAIFEKALQAHQNRASISLASLIVLDSIQQYID